MKNKNLYLLLMLNMMSAGAYAAELDMNTAKMQAMDKITGRVSEINVPVNGEVKFGSLSIVVRSCKTRPAEETPDNFAFVDVSDTTLQGEELNIFKGWMISSSPATHAVEHPIYDVWLLKCIDTKVDADSLWSEAKLAERDKLPQERVAESVVAADLREENTPPAAPLPEMTEEKAPDSARLPEPAVEFSYDEEEPELSDSVDEELENLPENLL